MGGERDLEVGVVGQEMQVSVKDGTGGEGYLEAGVVGQEMQVDVEDVATLAAPKIIHEQVQACGDVGETCVANANIIEEKLEKIILTIVR
jgi:hypothetical protein